jgi:GNAT superfamily N-acetyltransferase
VIANSKDIKDVVSLLNKATLKLHEKGINQWVYPWNPKEIEKDVLKKYVYLLKSDDLIVGTFSIKDMEPTDFFNVEPNSKYLYRLAISPEYQGKGLGLEILNYCFEYVRKMNVSLFLDCWAGNGKLRSFYKNAGFKHVGDFPEEDYFISVFKFNTD